MEGLHPSIRPFPMKNRRKETSLRWKCFRSRQVSILNRFNCTNMLYARSLSLTLSLWLVLWFYMLVAMCFCDARCCDCDAGLEELLRQPALSAFRQRPMPNDTLFAHIFGGGGGGSGAPQRWTTRASPFLWIITASTTSTTK